MSAAVVAATPSPATSSHTASSSPPIPSADGSSVGPTIHSFSFEWMDSWIHAQIWFLQSSLFVWIGDQSASMHSLALAIQSNMDSSPSVSTLLGHGHALGSGSTPGQGNAGGASGEEDQTGVGMASRIAAVFGVPVFVSINLSTAADSLSPGGGAGPEVANFVERSVIKELKTCQKLGMIKKE